MSARIVAVTMATHANAALEDWQITAERCGYETRVLGLGEAWRGFRQKLEHYCAEANRRAVESPNTLLLFTDAYDVLFNAPMTAALQVFQACGQPILTGMESGCFALHCAGPMPVDAHCRYVNSGVILGTPEALAQALTLALREDTEDDQLAWGRVCKTHRSVAFDTKRQLVANVLPKGEDHLSWDQGRQAVLVNAQQPCIVHFPVTVVDWLKRESLLRSWLVGPHRQPSWLDVSYVFWNKYRGIIVKSTIVLAAIVGAIALWLYSRR